MRPKPLQLRTCHFLLPKSGQALAECEDAIGINAEALRYAVADGATEAFDAGNWARRLAHCWAESRTPALSTDDFRAWVAHEGKAQQDSWEGLSLAWYAEEKRRGGSYAAFVGIQFALDDDEPTWQAIALGDSCLIHCRGRDVVTALPLADYRRFNAAPVLVPSLAAMQAAALSQAVEGRGRARAGDHFLLLSDAAAAWYLMLSETSDPLRASFEALLFDAKQDDLADFFERERLAHRIKDDDIAILSLEVACA